MSANRCRIYTVFQTPMMVISIILHSFAISSTIFRLAYRARFRQLWWDDFWAFFALINTVLFFAAHLRASLEFPPIFFYLFDFIYDYVQAGHMVYSIKIAITRNSNVSELGLHV
ncbi:hypothetical protein BDQ17DRAFT_1505819 [Cyathus striatus]|nr:hypothetical protein BDQ17DRAFT_1505819 [Cyathus striatus]